MTSPRGTTAVVEPQPAGVRLDKWLAAPARLGSRRRAVDALLRGRVWVDDIEQALADAARRLAGGEVVRIWIDRPGSATRQGPHRSAALEIVYEDRDLLVLDKPWGLLTVPLPEQPETSSLADQIADYWRSHGRIRPFAVHRLDRDTSGLVLFARTPRAQAALRGQFFRRTPERRYLAVVHGTPSPAEGTWRTWLRWDSRTRIQRLAPAGATRAHEAIGHFRVVEHFGEAASLLAVQLVTGKQHQIRAQAWVAGHPLVGECRYVGPPAPEPSRPVEHVRQALHATRLAIVHPDTGETLVFEREPPEDFRTLLERLRRGAR